MISEKAHKKLLVQKKIEELELPHLDWEAYEDEYLIEMLKERGYRYDDLFLYAFKLDRAPQTIRKRIVHLVDVNPLNIKLEKKRKEWSQEDTEQLIKTLKRHKNFDEKVIVSLVKKLGRSCKAIQMKIQKLRYEGVVKAYPTFDAWRRAIEATQ